MSCFATHTIDYLLLYYCGDIGVELWNVATQFQDLAIPSVVSGISISPSDRDRDRLLAEGKLPV